MMATRPPPESEEMHALVVGAAQWAAAALEQLAGLRLSARDPRRVGPGASPRVGPWEVGLFVEVKGAFTGVVALLLTGDTRDTLVKALLGTGEETQEAAESALRELGNIVASQAVSAMAASLSGRLVPSVPTLASRNAESALAAAIRRRGALPGAARFEVPLLEPRAGLRALLVVAPDAAPDSRRV